jgi:hypothetical protein
MAAQLIATDTNPAPPGHTYLPPNWWLRPYKVVRPDLYFHQILPISRVCMYTCRNGPVWIGNNWHSYRIHIPNNSGRPQRPFPIPDNGVWCYAGGPIRLEPVTRLQLLMESLWTVS